MSPTLTTFLFELANFLLLAAAIGWLLFKPVRSALEARRAEEQRRVDALAERERQVRDAQADMSSRRTAFDQETVRLRQQRLAAAETEAAALVARAREAAARERDRGQRMLAHLEDAQVERLAGAVAAAARAAVGRLLTTLQAPDLDAALVGAACRQLEADDQPLGAVLVESASTLDDDARKALAAATNARAISIDFRVVPDLGAGVRVTTARGLIDASSAGLAAHTERLLVAALAGSESGQEH